MTTELNSEANNVQPTTEENVAEVLSDDDLDAVSGGNSTLSITSKQISDKINSGSTTDLGSRIASDIKTSIRNRIS